ncbi:hypothetical protein NBO_375g0002 [Nosema bombycis CQ1]|uniref:Uncharacterized protein n=1 Tax=Nosema bombycis (strain CQ1 / CVCC 102059) TaxID=578461 RepID=R0M3X1_NOSB1|nr:hypothetical protein NBO_375g0002 [Nosema bombycis CQ1]|eukprot:EOB12724.1 hypothetical protein NBO_375g0002 [Nosema bombycis CQ1]
MRRVTDLKSKKFKKAEDSIVKQKDDLNLNLLNKDIVFILQGYETRIKIKNKTKRDSNIFKSSYERYLLYTNQKPFYLDIFPFINLETVIIKNSDELNLDLLSTRPFKTLYISNINKIFINKDLSIEEIYFKNIKITLKVILKILSSPILKSINLNNVQIITKDDNNLVCSKTNCDTSSITQHMMSFTSIDEVRYRDYNSESQNNTISEIISLKIEQNSN